MPQQQQSRSTQYKKDLPQADPVVVKNALAKVSGTFSVANQVNERLMIAMQTMHLISPATSVGQLPEGCGIALAAVVVDCNNETYDVGSSKRGLAKSALDRIAASLGVSWNPEECIRVDDGSDPHYVHFRVAGYYRAFDGQVQVISGNKEMDLRDGSPTCVEIEAQVQKHNNHPKVKSGEWNKRDAINQIRQMRAHILAHAESKAKLRAIRSLGVRASYTVAELQKPFVCARVMFTGQTEDRELRRMFAAKTAESFLNGRNALYGQGPAPRHVVGAGATGHAPPTLSHMDDDDAYPTDDDRDDGDAPAEPEGATVHTFVIPGGRNQGTPLCDATDGDLQYWATRIGKELDEGTSRDTDRDAALHDALLDEIHEREQRNPPAANSGNRQQELKT